MLFCISSPKSTSASPHSPLTHSRSLTLTQRRDNDHVTLPSKASPFTRLSLFSRPPGQRPEELQHSFNLFPFLSIPVCFALSPQHRPSRWQRSRSIASSFKSVFRILSPHGRTICDPRTASLAELTPSSLLLARPTTASTSPRALPCT